MTLSPNTSNTIRYPSADANSDDPSAVVRWAMNGEQYAAACATSPRFRDDLRALCF